MYDSITNSINITDEHSNNTIVPEKKKKGRKPKKKEEKNEPIKEKKKRGKATSGKDKPSGKVEDKPSGKVKDKPSGKVKDKPSGKVKSMDEFISDAGKVEDSVEIGTVEDSVEIGTVEDSVEIGTVESIDELSNCKKKRGRKPVGKIIILDEQEINTSIKEDDCIITHFPIKLSDIEQNINLGSTTQEEFVDYDDTEDYTDETQNIFIKSCDISENVDDNIKIENKSKKEIIKEYENKIMELNDIITTLNTNTGLKSRMVKEANVTFNYIADEKKQWKEKTDVYCWWCCHPYDTCPISLPEKVHDNIFYVFGSFCSFNCAAAYNINMDDYKIWERLTLLKSLYMKIHKKDADIVPAPPRKTLEIFGGYLSINKFRSDVLKFNKEFIYLIPPMISMTPLIEESTKSLHSKGGGRKFIPLYSSNNVHNTEKLMRNKPINNAKYSLVKTMGLKKKNAKKQNEFFI
jgi:hypothetical protein